VWLARYGRQSMLQWDDVDVIEMYALAQELRDLMDEERVSPEDG